MMKWQPIETAPKDGTAVILAFPDWKWPVIGHWTDRKRMEYGVVTYERQYWFTDRRHMAIAKEAEPTHWIPLPPLPEA